MRTLRATVRLEMNGRPMRGFPIRAELSVPEAEEHILNRQPHGDHYLPVPENRVDAPQIVAISTDRTVTLRVGGQSSKGVPILRNGLFFLFNGKLCAPAEGNVLINNENAEAAKLTGGIIGGRL